MPQTPDSCHEQPHIDKIAWAIFCSITANFLFFVMSWAAKYLADTHHVVEITFYRNLITFFPFLIFVLATKKRHILRVKNKRLVALRSVLGIISMIVTYAALSYLPMSYATVLFFTSALFIPVQAFFFLKEKVTTYHWIAILIGMLGVIVIAQPSGAFSLIGLFLALLTAFVHGTSCTVLRGLKTEDPLTILFYFVLAGFVGTSVLLPWVSQPIASNEIWIFIVIAISGIVAQLLITQAYKYAPASFIVTFGYSSIIWNILADIFYWKYDIDMSAIIIGTGLIFCAQIYLVLRERASNNKAMEADTPL